MVRISKRALLYFSLALLSGTALARAATHSAPDIEGDGGVSAFYRWDAAITQPGLPLREETFPATLSRPKVAGTALRILYTATSGVGRGLVPVSGIVYLPAGAPPPGGWPILAWAHGTTGFADVCAPSWRGQPARDVAYLQRWMEAGFAVVATDYEGLGTKGVHPYLLWKSEGRSILDAVRAALKAKPGVLRNQVVIAGQSQGSGAALGATYLAPDYAPDLHVLGTVATGLVVTFAGPQGDGYVKKPEQYTDPRQMDPGFAMLRIAGIDRALHPELDPADFVTAKGRPLLDAARTSCLHDLFALSKEKGLTGEEVFVPDLKPLDADMEPNFVLPVAKMTVPIFAGTGLADGMAGTAGQYNAVKAMCDAGTRVQWHVYPGLSHNGAVNGSLADSLPFVQALLKGETPKGNCAGITPPGPVQASTPGIPFND
ncbi:lipase family protein [Nitrospirillum amazonense]|uniref:lipase family protein n=1 Tax=Nitrospirillum amazonense TaxID=28077 RepID=UPI00241224E3|nr:lipase family protein [Nitrospirillum amazonense]MDG3439602.1 lipase family protein [Nitrospirillum amazonense]